MTNRLEFILLWSITFCSALTVMAVSHPQTARIIDNLIETSRKKNNDTVLYEYNTVDSQNAADLLHQSSETTIYETMFPEGSEHVGETKKMINFRDSVFQVLYNDVGMKKALTGQRIHISVYVKPDGTTICTNITSRERLLDRLSIKAIKQMISIINSYKFEAAKTYGNYYWAFTVVLQFP